MTVEAADQQSFTFGFIHGRWHRPEHWQLLTTELHDAGHRTVNVDLATNNSLGTIESELDIAVETLKHYDDLVVVGHSRAANMLPHLAGRMSLTKMVYIAGSFHPPTLTVLGDMARKLPARQPVDFLEGITDLGKGFSRYSPSLAREMFYGDCSPEVAEWAISLLRGQRETDTWPPVRHWPQLPQDYILCRKDRVIRPAWSRAVCKLLGIPVHELDSDHSPFVSHAIELSKLLVALAQE